jgi:nicotinamide-nucleotide amidase
LNLEDTAKELTRLLESHGHTVSFAESCTGGLLSATITSIPGVSKVYKGGVVAYDNGIKHCILGVQAAILEMNGAVSRECAEAMASGVAERFQTDHALSVTGIAGPDGGSLDKPVGTVWFGLASRGNVSAVHIRFSGNRREIREAATRTGLELITASVLASFELDNPADGGVTLGQV